MLWPLTSVWVRLGLVPRRLTRSLSSKPPSLALDELMLTPGRRCSVSATFLAGSLPMSSAVTTSTCEAASFFSASDSASLSRMPVTVMVASSLAFSLRGAVFWLASCACSVPARHRPAMMLAANSVLRCDMVSSPQSQIGNGCCVCRATAAGEVAGQLPGGVERRLRGCCVSKTSDRRQVSAVRRNGRPDTAPPRRSRRAGRAPSGVPEPVADRRASRPC